MKRPIAMKCTQEQFDSIKDILIQSGMHVNDFIEGYDYLIHEVNIAQCSEWYAQQNNIDIHEEWNAQIFLEACGINNVGRYDIYQEIGQLLDKAKKQGLNIKIIIE